MMSNYKFKILIKPEAIYNNLLFEQKKLFNNIQITNAELLNNNRGVEIECLALESDTVETPFVQLVEFSKDKHITVKEI